MKCLALFILLGLTACEVDKEELVIATIEQNVHASKFTLNCTFDQNAMHSFVRYPAALADKYDCTGFAKMDCSRHVSQDGEEIRCENPTLNDLNDAPEGCVAFGSDQGSRLFFDGTYTDAQAYDCGIYEQRMRCIYHQADDGSQENMLCDASQMPPPDREQIYGPFPASAKKP